MHRVLTRSSIASLNRCSRQRPGLLTLPSRDLKVGALDLRRDALIVGSEVGQPADRLLRVTEQPTRGKAGKGGGFVQVTMRDIQSQNTLTHKFSTGAKVETVELDGVRRFTLLYSDGEHLHLMEDETMDQIEVPLNLVSDEQQRWLFDTMEIRVQMRNEQPLLVTLAARATFAVAEAPQAKGGDTMKTVVLENGERIRVPQFVEVGQRIVVNTADGTYHSKMSS